MLDSCVTTIARETRPVFTFENERNNIMKPKAKKHSIFEVIQVEIQSIFFGKISRDILTLVCMRLNVFLAEKDFFLVVVTRPSIQPAVSPHHPHPVN